MPHAHPPHHHEGHADHLGNPHDLEAYLAKLEGRDRAAWQKPDAVVRALKLRRSQVVAEVGAGPGYFARRLAKVAGHVWALEAQPEIFEVLAQRAAEVPNLAPVRVEPGDPRLPPASVDLVLLVNAYHHLSGVPYLRALKRALKRGGRIAVVDFHPESELGPQHKVSREDVLADAKRAGLRLVRQHTFLAEQYFLELGR